MVPRSLALDRLGQSVRRIIGDSRAPDLDGGGAARAGAHDRHVDRRCASATRLPPHAGRWWSTCDARHPTLRSPKTFRFRTVHTTITERILSGFRRTSTSASKRCAASISRGARRLPRIIGQRLGKSTC